MENNNDNLVQEENIQESKVEMVETEPESQTLQGIPSEEGGDKSPKSLKTGHRRILEGRVVSDKPNKTIVVLVERYVQHPLYKKYYKRSKKFMAHDEHNECRVGDLVRIIEWRPLSRRKRWMLKEIVERAK